MPSADKRGRNLSCEGNVDKKKAKRGRGDLTVEATGAAQAVFLRGVVMEDGTGATEEALQSVRGTVLQVVSGCVWPSPSARDAACKQYDTPSAWAQEVASKRGAPLEATRATLNLLHPPESVNDEFRLGMMASKPPSTAEADVPMHDSDGNACKLKIVALGDKWQHLGLEVGYEVCPCALARLIDGKQKEDRSQIGFLCLRRNLWIEGRRSCQVESFSDDDVHLDVHRMLGMDARSPREAYDVDQMVEAVNRLAAGSFKVSRRQGHDSSTDENVGVVVTTMKDTVGYNMQRLGCVITGVYASSPARRHQLRGRIKRIGQVRAAVRYVTIIPADTILSLLYERHNAVDAVSASLEQLAQSFLVQNSAV